MKHRFGLPACTEMTLIQNTKWKSPRSPRKLEDTVVYLHILCLYTQCKEFLLMESLRTSGAGDISSGCVHRPQRVFHVIYRKVGPM